VFTCDILIINELGSQRNIEDREGENIVYDAYILKQISLNEKATSECNPEKVVGCHTLMTPEMQSSCGAIPLLSMTPNLSNVSNQNEFDRENSDLSNAFIFLGEDGNAAKKGWFLCDSHMEWEDGIQLGTCRDCELFSWHKSLPYLPCL